MGKGTNQIATELEAKTIGGGGTQTADTKCVTKTRATALGCSIRNSYENNQTVKYSDLYKTSPYSITYTNDGNGTVAGPTSAVTGSTVSITVTPNSGYERNSVTYTSGGSSNNISGTSFTMPNEDTTVNATFKKGSTGSTGSTGGGGGGGGGSYTREETTRPGFSILSVQNTPAERRLWAGANGHSYLAYTNNLLGVRSVNDYPEPESGPIQQYDLGGDVDTDVSTIYDDYDEASPFDEENPLALMCGSERIHITALLRTQEKNPGTINFQVVRYASNQYEDLGEFSLSVNMSTIGQEIMTLEPSGSNSHRLIVNWFAIDYGYNDTYNGYWFDIYWVPDNTAEKIERLIKRLVISFDDDSNYYAIDFDYDSQNQTKQNCGFNINPKYYLDNVHIETDTNSDGFNYPLFSPSYHWYHGTSNLYMYPNSVSAVYGDASIEYIQSTSPINIDSNIYHVFDMDYQNGSDQYPNTIVGKTSFPTDSTKTFLGVRLCYHVPDWQPNTAKSPRIYFCSFRMKEIYDTDHPSGISLTSDNRIMQTRDQLDNSVVDFSKVNIKWDPEYTQRIRYNCYASDAPLLGIQDIEFMPSHTGSFYYAWRNVYSDSENLYDAIRLEILNNSHVLTFNFEKLANLGILSLIGGKYSEFAYYLAVQYAGFEWGFILNPFTNSMCYQDRLEENSVGTLQERRLQFRDAHIPNRFFFDPVIEDSHWYTANSIGDEQPERMFCLANAGFVP